MRPVHIDRYPEHKLAEPSKAKHKGKKKLWRLTKTPEPAKTRPGAPTDPQIKCMLGV